MNGITSRAAPPAQAATPAQALEALLTSPRRYLRLRWVPQCKALWLYVRIRPVQCYSLAGMAELQAVLDHLALHPGLVQHFVLASDTAGVFNFGGDLALFVLLARARDLESLRMYGRRCLDLVWWMENAATQGVHTVALLQGDALGGGLESVLPFHHVVAERATQAGYPEVLFNLFPGMGAWDFSARKVGIRTTQQMVLSGKIYSGEALHALGVVDTLAEDGQGMAVVQSVIDAVTPRLRGTLAALRARNLAAPVSRVTLSAIVDQWAMAALDLSDRDLRLMERLVRAQLKKNGGAAEGAIEELKRMELEQALTGQR
ncbi:MAG: enoyl-CoA hydratase/isomerase family protein [Burkholderiales bacterium]|nr:enoyl-CoA hydratase/isomerase family protein [Burkholderiales bacterium]